MKVVHIYINHSEVANKKHGHKTHNKGGRRGKTKRFFFCFFQSSWRTQGSQFNCKCLSGFQEKLLLPIRKADVLK